MRTLLLAAAALLPAAASAATLTRGPFLQQTSQTSTLLVARTDAPATVLVDVRDAKGEGTSARSSGTEHVLRVEGLRPATTYTYELSVDGAPVHADAFRTAPAPRTADGRSVVLGVVGDMGTGGPNERAHVDRLVEAGVDALLTVGDNSYPEGAPEEWDPKFFEPFAPLLSSVPVFPAVGDHEYLTPYAAGYLDAFVLPEGPSGERYHSFDWGDVHVTVLDSNCLDPMDGPRADGCDETTMLAWLDADLAATDASWKVVTVHRPAVASGRYGPSAPVARALPPLLEAHGVDLVLQGNNHFWERSWPLRGGAVVQRGYDAPGAPVYVTSGGGGDWLYDSAGPQPPWSAYRETVSQHALLRFAGDRLTVEARGTDGSVIDTFTITKPIDRGPVRLAPCTPARGVAGGAVRLRGTPCFSRRAGPKLG